MLSILDHPIVSSRYFFPRAAGFADPYWVEAADGSRLACYFRARDVQDTSDAPDASNAPAKTLIYFHGNGEVVADYVPDFANWFNRMGCNILLVEYRGYGMSTGTPSLAGMLDDVVPIIESLKSLHVPDQQIILFGRSIGSLYAVHGAAQRPHIGGLILESGVAEFGERFFLRVQAEELGVPEAEVLEALSTTFDYKQKLGTFQGQTLILHARHDELVGAEHAEKLYAASSEPKQLKIFDQGGHNDIFFRNRIEYMQLVENFVAEV